MAAVLGTYKPRLIVLQPTSYCNINCEYCYLRNRDDRRIMPLSVVEAIKDKLLSHLKADAATRIIWHAGEPTTVPLSWYEGAYNLLRPAAPPGVVFAIQTNGVALSASWIDFLQRSDTQVGISIDGPERFHDARRKTRTGAPTWSLAMVALHRLQAAKLMPSVITVLHRECLESADDFYRFYRDNNIQHVSFSIDEINGANRVSSFGGIDARQAMAGFLRRMLSLAYLERYPLVIREIERVSEILSQGVIIHNEQAEPWEIIVVAADGDMTTFSPDLMELTSGDHNNFRFGNILRDDLESLFENAFLKRTTAEISAGVENCRRVCEYFELCGGGSPSNKMAENRSLASVETAFCRLSIQAPADALLQFLRECAAEGDERSPEGRFETDNTVKLSND